MKAHVKEAPSHECVLAGTTSRCRERYGEYENATGRAEDCAAKSDKIEKGANDKENDLSRTNEESMISFVGIDPPDTSSETRVLSVEVTADGSCGRMASKELSRSSSRSKSKVKPDMTTECPDRPDRRANPLSIPLQSSYKYYYTQSSVYTNPTIHQKEG